MATHYQGSSKEVLVLNAWIKLTRARDSVGQRIRPTVEQNGLTLAQFGVLDALYHLGPQNQKLIGEKLLCSGGNVTRVVDNLERDGFVLRKTNPLDRRYYHVRLTSSGRERIKKVFSEHLEVLVEAFSVLSPEEQAELGRLCKKLGIGVSKKT